MDQLYPESRKSGRRISVVSKALSWNCPLSRCWWDRTALEKATSQTFWCSFQMRFGMDWTQHWRPGGVLPFGRDRGDVTVGVGIDLHESLLEYEFSLRFSGTGEHRVRTETVTATPKEGDTNRIALGFTDGQLTTPSVSRVSKRSSESIGQPISDMGPEFFKAPASDLALSSPLFPFWTFLAIGTQGFSKSGPPLVVVKELLSEIRRYHIFPNALREPRRTSAVFPLNEDAGNLGSVLEEMIKKRGKDFRELLAALGHVVPGIKNIGVKSAGGHLYLQFTHEPDKPNAKDLVLEGFQESDGTLRLLGLLVALYQQAPGLKVIEEPELTIHPGALAYIAELMGEVATERMSLLVTTHSPDFLDLVPVNSIRAVEMTDGGTIAGLVAEDQRNAVTKKLFTPGELHSMEGLRVSGRFG